MEIQVRTRDRHKNVTVVKPVNEITIPIPSLDNYISDDNTGIEYNIKMAMHCHKND